MKPARFGLVVRLGMESNIFHGSILMISAIFILRPEDQNMNGAYNAVAPEHINHNDFVRTMARVMDKPFFLPPVPACILKMVMGEMSDIVLKGSRISTEKIIKAGYRFRFENLMLRLKILYPGYPLFEMISSLFKSTTSIVFPKTLIIPSFLKSDIVLITFAVLIPI